MLGHRNRYQGYEDYVEQGIDDDIKRFYSKGNVLSVLGDKAFKTCRQEEVDAINLEALRLALRDRPSLEDIVGLVCKMTQVKKEALLAVASGKRVNNPVRSFAMYACQYFGGAKHREITDYFGLSHAGSVSHSLTRIRREITCGKWRKEVKAIEKHLFVAK